MDSDLEKQRAHEDFASSFMQSLGSEPSQVSRPNAKKSRRWLVLAIAVLVVVVVVLAVVLGVILAGGAADSDLSAEDYADQHAYESYMSEEEVLNSSYAAAVSENEHAYYESTLEHTRLLGYVPSEVCALLEVSCSDLAHPESLSNFTKVGALNTSALDYYLDNGHVVIISAKGSYPYTDDGDVLVVYAVDYYFGQVFTAFTPPKSGKTSPLMELTRTYVISSIIGVPECYISNKTL